MIKDLTLWQYFGMTILAFYAFFLFGYWLVRYHKGKGKIILGLFTMLLAGVSITKGWEFYTRTLRYTNLEAYNEIIDDWTWPARLVTTSLALLGIGIWATIRFFGLGGKR